MHFGSELDQRAARDRYRDWITVLEQNGVEAAAPRARTPAAIAHAFGADTQAVLAEFDVAC
jgi:hypothetical protein